MTSREMIEFMSKGGAGVISQTADYNWVHVLNRFDMYVHKNDKSVAPHLVNDGFWESWITKWVMDNVSPDTLFIDVGANTGYYSFLANTLGAVVYSFEPNKIYSEMMNSTIARGHWKGVFVFDWALSNYNGEAVLNIPTELHGSASLSDIVPGYETTKQTVKVRMFDEDFSGRLVKPTVVKIDAEGEEERVLEGMRKVIDSADDLVVLLEYTPGAYSQGFVDHLFETYHVCVVDYSGEEREIVPQFLEAQTDWVMLVLR